MSELAQRLVEAGVNALDDGLFIDRDDWTMPTFHPDNEFYMVWVRPDRAAQAVVVATLRELAVAYGERPVFPNPGELADQLEVQE